VQMGPLSVFRRKRSKRAEIEEESEASPVSSTDGEEQLLNLEGQGIMVYDRTTGVESHVYSLRPYLCFSHANPQ
jgi:serine/threonine-protein kinase RIM15